MHNLKDIKKISIPFNLPGGPGSANIYIIFGNPLSLIDTGPRTKGALEEIEKAIEDKGLKLKDIKRIFLTHGHIDHFGLANQIAKISNATIFIHKEDLYKVKASFEQQFENNFPLVQDYFQQSGVPENYFFKYKHFLKEIFYEFAEPVQAGVESILNEETLHCGERNIKSIHLPGHTPGSVSYYDQSNGLLFSGDHLLPDITPNPLLELYAKINNGYQSLKSYLNSLKQTKELKAKLVLPGHGKNIINPKSLIEKFYQHHEQRKDNILKIVSRGGCNKWKICCSVFGKLEVRDVYLGLSEVEGHLELLEEEGKVLKRRNHNQDIYYPNQY